MKAEGYQSKIGRRTRVDNGAHNEVGLYTFANGPCARESQAKLVNHISINPSGHEASVTTVGLDGVLQSKLYFVISSRMI